MQLQVSYIALQQLARGRCGVGMLAAPEKEPCDGLLIVPASRKPVSCSKDEAHP